MLGRRLLFIGVFALAEPPADLRRESASAACFDVRCQPCTACSSPLQYPVCMSGIRASLPGLVKWMRLWSGLVWRPGSRESTDAFNYRYSSGRRPVARHGARLVLSMNLSSVCRLDVYAETPSLLSSHTLGRGQSRVEGIGETRGDVKW